MKYSIKTYVVGRYNRITLKNLNFHIPYFHSRIIFSKIVHYYAIPNNNDFGVYETWFFAKKAIFMRFLAGFAGQTAAVFSNISGGVFFTKTHLQSKKN